MSKSGENKVVKAGIGYTIGNYMLKGLTFLTIPIFSRIMSTADYGIYNTFVAYEGILFILIGVAIHSSYKNARYKYCIDEGNTDKTNDYNTYISSTMVLLLVSLGCWFLVGNIFGHQISGFLGLDVLSLNLLLIYSFSMAAMQCYNSDLALKYQFQNFLKVSGINAISNIVLSIVLMVTIFSEQRYMGRVIGTTVPIFIIAVYIITTFFKRARPTNTVKYLKWGVKYSLPIVPHGISQVILSQFDRIMINNMIGAATAGIYSFAYNIYTIVNVTTQSLDGVWNTWFYEQMSKQNYQEIRNRSKVYMLAMLLFVSAIILISPEIIKLLGPEEYWEAMYCVAPIVAGGYFSFLYNLPAAIEYYREKTKFIAIGTVSAAIVNIGLNFIFIKYYGYIAAAYTTMFTYLLYFVFHFVIAWKIEKRCIFSIKTVLLCCVTIIAVNFITIACVDIMIIRWLMALLIGVLFIFYVGKQLDVIEKIRKKL